MKITPEDRQHIDFLLKNHMKVINDAISQGKAHFLEDLLSREKVIYCLMTLYRFLTYHASCQLKKNYPDFFSDILTSGNSFSHAKNFLLESDLSSLFEYIISTYELLKTELTNLREEKPLQLKKVPGKFIPSSDYQKNFLGYGYTFTDRIKVLKLVLTSLIHLSSNQHVSSDDRYYAFALHIIRLNELCKESEFRNFMSAEMNQNSSTWFNRIKETRNFLVKPATSNVTLSGNIKRLIDTCVNDSNMLHYANTLLKAVNNELDCIEPNKHNNSTESVSVKTLAPTGNSHYYSKKSTKKKPQPPVMNEQLFKKNFLNFLTNNNPDKKDINAILSLVGKHGVDYLHLPVDNKIPNYFCLFAVHHCHHMAIFRKMCAIYRKNINDINLMLVAHFFTKKHLECLLEALDSMLENQLVSLNKIKKGQKVFLNGLINENEIFTDLMYFLQGKYPKFLEKILVLEDDHHNSTLKMWIAIGMWDDDITLLLLSQLSAYLSSNNFYTSLIKLVSYSGESQKGQSHLYDKNQKYELDNRFPILLMLTHLIILNDFFPLKRTHSFLTELHSPAKDFSTCLWFLLANEPTFSHSISDSNLLSFLITQAFTDLCIDVICSVDGNTQENLKQKFSTVCQHRSTYYQKQGKTECSNYLAGIHQHIIQCTASNHEDESDSVLINHLPVIRNFSYPLYVATVDNDTDCLKDLLVGIKNDNDLMIRIFKTLRDFIKNYMYFKGYCDVSQDTAALLNRIGCSIVDQCPGLNGLVNFSDLYKIVCPEEIDSPEQDNVALLTSLTELVGIWKQNTCSGNENDSNDNLNRHGVFKSSQPLAADQNAQGLLLTPTPKC